MGSTRPAGVADVHAVARANPFSTTPHVDGHPSVLVRASRLAELDVATLTEVVQDAWCSRASRRRVADWLASRRAPGPA